MSARDLAAQTSSCPPRGGVPRRHQRGAFKGSPDGARRRNCTRRCQGGDTNSGSRNRFKFSSWARDDRGDGGGSHSSPQWQSSAAPAPLATERVPNEVMRPRSVPAIEVEEAVVNPWSTEHARDNVPRLDVNESGNLEDARGARVAREEALVDFDAVSIPEERGVQMGIIRDDVDRRSSKVMRLIDKIRTFPHGMDVGIALQPAVLGDNESMRLPPREILEAAEEHLGDLRALEIWSWIERQFYVAGKYNDKKSVQEFVDASRAAIVLCGRLGLPSRAESTARRMVDDFGDIFTNEQRGGDVGPSPSSNPASGSTVLGASGYAGLAAAYARSNEIGKLETMWDSLTNNRIRSSPDVFSEIFKGFVACWRVNDAVAVAAQAKEKGMALPKAVWEEGLVIFTSRADEHGGIRRRDRDMMMGEYTLALLHAMCNEGHVPSRDTLQNLLVFLIGEKERENVRIIDDIAEVFTMCLVSGYQPEVHTYSDIIFLLGKAGRFQDAVELFVSLLSRASGGGGADIPTYAICESLLSAAAAAQGMGETDLSRPLEDAEVDEAAAAVVDTFGLYRSFVKLGVQPSIEMYNIAAAACSLDADWESIYEIMEDMRSDGLYPTTRVVQAALSALRRARMLNLSTELFEHQERLSKMKEWQQQRDRLRDKDGTRIDIGLDDVCYSEYLLTLMTCNKFREATRHHSAMLKARILPTEEAILCYFRGACLEGKFRLALHSIQDLLRLRYTPSEELGNDLIYYAETAHDAPAFVVRGLRKVFANSYLQ